MRKEYTLRFIVKIHKILKGCNPNRYQKKKVMVELNNLIGMYNRSNWIER